MGVSIGASTALEWNARHNTSDIPVVAMAPVVMSRFSYLGVRPLARVVGGLFMRRVAVKSVQSPLGAGVEITTNAKSEEYRRSTRRRSVPASLFSDVARMLLDTTLRARRRQAPILLVQAGNDSVGYNSLARIWSRIFPRRLITRCTVVGAAHDLSQETNHAEFVNTLTRWTYLYSGPKQHTAHLK
jgi:alpha-beta hydrolase superfamily lysophospholipase